VPQFEPEVFAMSISKIKIGLVSTIAVALLVLAGRQMLVSGNLAAAQPAQLQTEDDEPKILVEAMKQLSPHPIDNSETAETKTMKLRSNCAKRELEQRLTKYRVGRGTLDIVLEANRHLRESDLELSSNADERMKVLRRCLAIAEGISELNQARFNAGALTEQDLKQSLFEKYDADLRILREQKTAKAGK
jgi:hypothetical protein